MYKNLKHYIRKRKLLKKLRKDAIYFDFSNFDKTKKGVLIIDSIIPEYDRDSGSRRLFLIIEIMLKRGFNVFLLADTKEYRFKYEYVETYRTMGAVVYQPVLDSNNNLIDRERFIQLIGPYIQFAWLHRPDIFHKYYSLVTKYSKAKLIFDMVDFHYLRFKREWQQNGDPKTKEAMSRYLKMELQNAERANVVVPITEEDKKELQPLLKSKTEMQVVGNVHQFKVNNPGFKNFQQRQNLLFIGSFIHTPNLDAVQYLYHKILPILREKLPLLKMEIIGSYAPREILDLNSENFRVHGFVDDISEYFNSAKLFVAPLAFGAGIKGKIGQSLEFGLPLVTTEIGAEGFNFSPFKNSMVAPMADPQAFAEKIIALYTNEVLWTEVSGNSEKVLEPFSISNIEANILKILS
ncbi:glycosyltransferase [Aequorivita sp. SDUM287046]|uniref:Glycosyltransferase n=1 Tax=Aequorivita aurantiaca TaxID=3053356 RepID=A0ABT8DHX4_9FLAO|nr:glycosyltransferase [Aequorivita aurantiaca]MDN3725012.1 glycosyltransferase [Aequorivita aurantiaca]